MHCISMCSAINVQDQIESLTVFTVRVDEGADVEMFDVLAELRVCLSTGTNRLLKVEAPVDGKIVRLPISDRVDTHVGKEYVLHSTVRACRVLDACVRG